LFARPYIERASSTGRGWWAALGSTICVFLGSKTAACERGFFIWIQARGL